MSQYTTDEFLTLVEEAYNRGEPLKLPEGADLSGIDLGRETIQKKLAEWRAERGDPAAYPPWCSPDTGGVNLAKAILNRANLREAQLQGAYLAEAQLQGADLEGAELQGAYLEGAQLQAVFLAWAEWDEKTKLEDADWGDFILGEELAGDFLVAEAAYRRLKRWYANNGQYDRAGDFFYREKEARRKGCGPGTGFKAAEVREALRQIGKALRRSLWPPRRWPFLWKGWPARLSAAWRWLRDRLWPRRPLSWLGLGLYRFLCGYGERPWRVLWWLAVLVAVPAVAYWRFGGFPDFWSALYFSAVSSVALGYGEWVEKSYAALVKGWGVAQTFAGSFLLALFLVTFVRKMSPR